MSSGRSNSSNRPVTGWWAFKLGQAQISYEADFTVPLCLVIGNEQKGIRLLVKSECDLLVQIRAAGPLDSLNAAAAATVALYEVLRQRLIPGNPE